MHVSRCEDMRHAGLIAALLRLHGPIPFHAEGLTHVRPAAGKSGRTDQELAGEAVSALRRDGDQVSVPVRLQSVHALSEPSRVLAEHAFRLFLGIVLRQGAIGVQIVLPAPSNQLCHAPTALTQRGGHTVTGGISGPDDDDVLSERIRSKLRLAVKPAVCRRVQILHGIADAAHSVGVHPDVSRFLCPTAEHHRIVFFRKPPGNGGIRCVQSGHETHTLVGHQADRSRSSPPRRSSG